MNQLQQVFDYQGKEVRTIIKNDEPWFVAKDVCKVLEINKYRDAVSRLDSDERVSVLVDTPGGPQEMIAINEPGLYELIMTSRKPEAKKFKRWVKHEVLPSIRKTGSYSIGQYQIPKTYPEALRLAADLAEENERLRPKAEAHDVFLMGVNSQAMDKVSKSLNGIGRNKLFAFLKANKILRYDNTPYQKYIDAGYFKIRQTSTTRGDKVFNVSQTLVTAKGHDFIYRLLKQVGIENVKRAKLKEIKEGQFLVQAINGF